MATIAVWSYSSTSPTKVCEDARLSDAERANDSGQTGWDIGLLFQTAGDLASKLCDLRDTRGLVHRLAINAHGAPGVFDFNSAPPRLEADDASFNRYSSQLNQIKTCLTADAAVLFMGCNVARGEAGTKLLVRVSQAMPGRTIVGFTTVGISVQPMRSGAFCQPPGMRDTPYENESTSESIKNQREAEVRTRGFPWASESSPHAKVVRDGNVTKNPDPPPYQGMAYLAGRWGVTIATTTTGGDWHGIFVFDNSARVYWANSVNDPRRHRGNWWMQSGDYYWEFDDDPPSNKRRFRLLKQDLKPISKGVILNTDTAFEMVKSD